MNRHWLAEANGEDAAKAVSLILFLLVVLFMMLDQTLTY